MNFKETIAKIQIQPVSPGLANVTMQMPIWKYRGEDGKIYIHLALLGGIRTVADNEEEVDSAVDEAVLSFFQAAHKFGKGAKEELKLLGWQIKKQNQIRYKLARGAKPKSALETTDFNVPNTNIVSEMMSTGININKSLSVPV
jgi:hypothetical protein